jgi:regulator of cell morphogenesis and NO signaling
MKRMQATPEQTISEIVRADYRTADVFKKHQINFCCSGKITLAEACVTGTPDLQTVIREIDLATRKVQLSNNIRYNEWKTDFLIDYIINVHHDYLVQTLAGLEGRLVHLADSHAKKYPQLTSVLNTFQQLSEFITEHLREEEETIFPYIRQIDSALRRREAYGNLFVRTMRKPLSNSAKDHGRMEELLSALSGQTDNYQPPADACTTVQVVYCKLKELHDDMIQHSHLENNILIPRALEIEKQLLKFTG